LAVLGVPSALCYYAVMNAEFFSDLLQRRPFQAFAIHLSNGEVHEVRHPENAAMTQTRIVVVQPQADRVTVCSFLHVANVEMLDMSS
jgi:hypothetical protein